MMQTRQEQKKPEESSSVSLLKKLDKGESEDSRGRLTKIKDNVAMVFDTIKTLVKRLALLKQPTATHPEMHLGLGSKRSKDEKNEEGNDGN